MKPLEMFIVLVLIALFVFTIAAIPLHGQIEQYDERGTMVGSVASGGAEAEDAGGGLDDRQRWVLEQLRAGATITRKAVEDHFGIGERTAKRILTPLTREGKIRYDATEKPGGYRATSPVAVTPAMSRTYHVVTT